MPEFKDQLLSIVKKNINVPGLFDGALDEILEPALLAAVAKTENKIDDVVVAALYPLLENELKKLVKQKWEELLKAPGELVSEVLGEPV